MEIDLLAIAPTTIVISGRNLDEVVHLLGLGVVRWIRELDSRAAASDERKVEITEIEVKTEQK